MFDLTKQPPKRKPRPKRVAPRLPLPKTNPLNDQVKAGELNGDIEHDDAKEASAILGLFKTVDDEARRTMANGYWTALVFPDEETCHEFLRRANLVDISEGRGAYVDGLEAAKRLGVELPQVKPIRFKRRRADKRLVKEVGVYDPSTDG